MTANVFDEDVERSLAAGMNAHLSKPIEPERLYDHLARLINEREEKK
jgi:CheY-like chemotaxis protein